MPLLQQAHELESAKPDGVAILTINVQDADGDVKDFMAANGYTMPALVDAGGRVGRAYGISAIPLTFLISRDGNIRYIKRGMFLSINEVNVVLNRVR